ncbi:MAG: RagB/SusD family nutrient uptake outer membrane protein [Chitinophagaceae bacterium]
MPDLMLPFPLATYSFDKYPRPTADFIDNVADKVNDNRFKLVAPIMVGSNHVADNYTSFCVGLGAGVVDQGYFVYKWRNTGSLPFNNPDNYPILRLADVKLMYAEAENELNGPGNAFTHLNDVRNRAGLSSLNLTDLPGKQAFRDEVDKQRRLELAFEGERWLDLLRYALDEKAGITHQITALDVIRSKKGTEDETYLLLPLPQSEINSNPKVTQNPGY